VSEPSVVTIRAKSRTGDIYVRHARFFPHDKWVTIEVPLEVAAALAKDPWLDVRGLPTSPEADVAPAEAHVDRQLTAARGRIDELERELARVLAAHAQELERLRDAHARDLSEVRRRTEREIRDGDRREAARENEPKAPQRQSPTAPPRR
jgi:hypothetical protein